MLMDISMPIYGTSTSRNLTNNEITNTSIYCTRYVDVIVKIDLKSGMVVDTYDVRGLYPKIARPAHSDCFNGIAYNEVDNTFLVTGKLWDKYFQLSLS